MGFSNAMTLYCSDCGVGNEDTTKFCSSCGKQIVISQGNQQQGYAQPQQGYSNLDQFQRPAYQQQVVPGQVIRPTGITILSVLTGISIFFTIIGLGNIFQFGTFSGISILINLALNIGVLYAMWNMKVWGIKFIIGARIGTTILSALDVFVITPAIIRQIYEELGFTGSEVELLLQAYRSVATLGFGFGVVITVLILGYIYSKKELFIHP